MKRATKTFLVFLNVLAMVFVLTACSCSHEWKDADCTTPKTCTKCKQTEGEALGHHWKDADCTSPKTCSVCGVTEGEPLEHTWKDADCTNPKTCSVCGVTEGEPLVHTWKDADCTAPKTCTVCGVTEGEPLEHTWEEATCTTAKTCTACGATEGTPLEHEADAWKVTKKPSCTEVGEETAVCAICGETVTREIEKTEHSFNGKWEVKVKATLKTDGTEIAKCSACGAEMESRAYKLPPFDFKKLQGKPNYSYDEFTKSWKYYAEFRKRYSDAEEWVNIILFGEDETGNLEEMEIRSGMYWKNSDKDPWVIKKLEMMVGEKIYTFDLMKPTDNNYSYSFLKSELSYTFIEDLAKANTVTIKLTYEGGGTQEYKPGSNPFRNLCNDVINLNIWDYYVDKYDWLTVVGDTTSVR